MYRKSLMCVYLNSVFPTIFAWNLLYLYFDGNKIRLFDFICFQCKTKRKLACAFRSTYFMNFLRLSILNKFLPFYVSFHCFSVLKIIKWTRKKKETSDLFQSILCLCCAKNTKKNNRKRETKAFNFVLIEFFVMEYFFHLGRSAAHGRTDGKQYSRFWCRFVWILYVRGMGYFGSASC